MLCLAKLNGTIHSWAFNNFNSIHTCRYVLYSINFSVARCKRPMCGSARIITWKGKRRRQKELITHWSHSDGIINCSGYFFYIHIRFTMDLCIYCHSMLILHENNCLRSMKNLNHHDKSLPTSPSSSKTSLNTPWAAGCWGPKLTVMFVTSFSWIGTAGRKENNFSVLCPEIRVGTVSWLWENSWEPF